MFSIYNTGKHKKYMINVKKRHILYRYCNECRLIFTRIRISFTIDTDYKDNVDLFIIKMLLLLG